MTENLGTELVVVTSDLSNDMKELSLLIKSILSVLHAELENIRSGGSVDKRLITSKTSELTTAITRLLMLENELGKLNAKLTGRRSPDDIDFDVLRSEIRCRLGRLRKCL